MRKTIAAILSVVLMAVPVAAQTSQPAATTSTAEGAAPGTPAAAETAEAVAIETAPAESQEPSQEAQPEKKGRWGRMKDKMKSSAALTAVKGAVIGAAAGALKTVISGGDLAENMAVGAVAGATIGFFIGRSKDRVVADRETNIRNQGWTPDKGVVSDLQALTPASETAVLGQETEFAAQYFVITTDPNEKIDLTFEIGTAPDEEALPKRWTVVQPQTRSIPSGPMMESTFGFKPGRWQPGTYYIHMRIKSTTSAIEIQKKVKLDVMAAAS